MSADYRYFNDTNGVTTELKWYGPISNKEFDAMFPGVKGKRYDSFNKIVGRSPEGKLMPITRDIRYKSHPSLHECNAKCMGGKCGGTCECSCGGKNHGINSH